MKTYARVDAGVVAELYWTDMASEGLFHPALRWADVTGLPVQVGWVEADGGFAAPPPAADVLSPPTLGALQTQLAALAAQIATLQAQG